MQEIFVVEIQLQNFNPKVISLMRPILAFQERMYRERATNYLTSELAHEKDWLCLSFNPCQKHEIAAK